MATKKQRRDARRKAAAAVAEVNNEELLLELSEDIREGLSNIGDLIEDMQTMAVIGTPQLAKFAKNAIMSVGHLQSHMPKRPEPEAKEEAEDDKDV